MNKAHQHFDFYVKEVKINEQLQKDFNRFDQKIKHLDNLLKKAHPNAVHELKKQQEKLIAKRRDVAAVLKKRGEKTREIKAEVDAINAHVQLISRKVRAHYR